MFLIRQERDMQKALAFNDHADSFDKSLSANDFIALSISYVGRAIQN